MVKERSPELKRALKARHTGNGLFAYVQFLEVRRRHLEGTILDLGSGKNMLAREMAIFGGGPYIVSVNPHLLHPSKRKRIPNTPGNNQVVGLAPNEIPFADASFNTILDFLGPLKHLHPNEIIPFLEEMLRLLQIGGEYRGYPFSHKNLPVQETIGRYFGSRVRFQTIPYDMRPAGYQNDPRVQDRLILRK